MNLEVADSRGPLTLYQGVFVLSPWGKVCEVSGYSHLQICFLLESLRDRIFHCSEQLSLPSSSSIQSPLPEFDLWTASSCFGRLTNH